MSTFSSRNIMDGNLVLKERTHRIKIKYSMHQYSICLHNLGRQVARESDGNCFFSWFVNRHVMCLMRIIFYVVLQYVSCLAL